MRRKKSLKSTTVSYVLFGTVIVALAWFASPVQAQTWYLVDDYSFTENPNGCWSYGGYNGNLNQPETFQLATTPFTDAASGNRGWFVGAHNGGGAHSWMNLSSSTMYSILPGELSIHPAWTYTQPAVIRWTAPQAGTVDVSGYFGRGDRGYTRDRAVYHNATQLWFEQAAVKTTFSLEGIAVEAGDVIAFILRNTNNTAVDATITMTSLQPPVADAGDDTIEFVGYNVTLDGTGSSDPNANYPLGYAWQIVSAPAGSASVLSGADTVSPSFVPDLQGSYEVELFVTDAEGYVSTADTVVITVVPYVETWDIADDYSGEINPNGSWSYGGNVGGADQPHTFELATTPFTDPDYGNWGWFIGAVNDGGAHSWKNTNIETIHSILPGEVSVHPAWLGAPHSGVIRWTAPITGNVDITGYFGIGDNGSNYWRNRFVCHNDTQLWHEYANTVTPFTLENIAVEKGDILVFVVSGVGAWGNTAVDATITPVIQQPPVADAGIDQTVHPGNWVTLDGSGSSDPDEHYPLSYAWQMEGKPQGSGATLTDADTVNPTFLPDLMGDYIIKLKVRDSEGLWSATDQVVVSTYNTAPVADAGDDQAVVVIGTTVQLDGTQSWDDDGDDITYLWQIDSLPQDSNAALSDPISAAPTFVADLHGDYSFKLVVTDSFLEESEADSVSVSFTNVKPVAESGVYDPVLVGTTVYLNGSGSYDENLDPMTYKWAFVSRPSGSAAVLSNPYVQQLDFMADVVGDYVITLQVHDGFESSDPSNVTITAYADSSTVYDKLDEFVAVLKALDGNHFKNRKKMIKPLVNKVNATVKLIDGGYYMEAIKKLTDDISKKMNGCATSGAPDKNDWIVTYYGQSQTYPLLVEAIDLLNGLIP